MTTESHVGVAKGIAAAKCKSATLRYKKSVDRAVKCGAAADKAAAKLKEAMEEASAAYTEQSEAYAVWDLVNGTVKTREHGDNK